MRGSLGLGLVIGLVVGAGAMYLALRPPWGGHGAAPADAPAVASTAGSAGSGHHKHVRPHRHYPHRGGRGAPAMTGGDSDDEAWANQGDTVEDTGPAPVQLTAADRALEWRGDDVSPPPHKVDMSSDARPLDDGEIRDTIASQSGAAQSCVVQAATNAALTATITVKMVVDEHGRVTREKLQAPHYLFEHGLLGCIRSALAHMHFPATGMPTLVTMPIHLT